MSDLIYNNYFAPLDNLAGASFGSNREFAAENIINKKNTNTPENFNDLLIQNSNNTNQKGLASYGGCHYLNPIDCGNAEKSIQDSRDASEKSIKSSISNILNADKPGYKKVLPFKDANGNLIEENTKGRLEKTNWPLDLALDGMGQGFKLQNGEYTRDGRFKFDIQGRLVTVEDETPLEICYEQNAPIDWSLKKIKIDTQGKVMDLENGEILGKIEIDKEKDTALRQGYIERPDINLPLEFMGLAQKLRLVDLNNNLSSLGAKLDGEALQLVKGL